MDVSFAPDANLYLQTTCSFVQNDGKAIIIVGEI